MFSADLKAEYANISPSLTGKVNEYLVVFNRLHKVLLDLLEKVGGIHNMAANELVSLVDTCNKKTTEITKGLTCSTPSSILTFLNECLNQITNQAKTIKNLQTRLEDTVIRPLREDVAIKKSMWKTCFHYADNFSQQVTKKDVALQKCLRQYSEAAMKVKPGNAMEKHLQIFHDIHNTYVLKLSSVNCINTVFFTHALPHVMQCIEASHSELNDKYRHHISNMFYIQSNTWDQLVKSDSNIKQSLERLDIVGDLKHFIKATNENVKDKQPSYKPFVVPKVEDLSTAAMLSKLTCSFIVNERTRPNLQRRLADLQQQTQQLVDDISERRSKDSWTLNRDGKDRNLKELVEFLSVCDKEANLNVLLKQMEHYSEDVIEFLGPIPQNLLLENKHTKKESPSSDLVFSSFPSNESSRPHEFIELRVMKPIFCFYCSKLIAMIGKGYVCKVCKVSVHKKCATSVKFCEPLVKVPPKESPTPTAPPESIPGSPPRDLTTRDLPPINRNSFVSNLIDIESDDDDYDDFDDGFSDEEFDNEDPSGVKPTPMRNFKQLQVDLARLVSSSNHSPTSPNPNNVMNTSPSNATSHSPIIAPKPSILPDIPVFKPPNASNSPVFDSKKRIGSSNVDLLGDLLDFTSDMSQTNQLQPPQQKTPIYAMIDKSDNDDDDADDYDELREDELTQPTFYATVDQPQRPNQYDEVTPEKENKDYVIYGNTADIKPTLADKPAIHRIQSVEGNESPPSSPSLIYARPEPKFNRLSFKDKKPMPTVKPVKPPRINIDKPPIVGPKPTVAPKPALSKKPSTSIQNGDAPPIPLPPRTASLSRKKSFCVTLYDFNGTEDSFMPFSAGKKIEITDKSSEEWWHGKLNNSQGYFPSSYVLELKSEMDVVLRILYNFDKEDNDELSVSQDEIVVLLKEENQWLQVKSKQGEGLVPASYVDYI